MDVNKIIIEYSLRVYVVCILNGVNLWSSVPLDGVDLP